MASVTLYLSGSYSPAANNFTVYCNTAAPGNAIATGVSQATLANGWCTDTVCSAYVVQSNTEECSYSYYVTVAGIPTPTPTATGTINPTATPTPTTTGPTLNIKFLVYNSIVFGNLSLILNIVHPA